MITMGILAAISMKALGVGAVVLLAVCAVLAIGLTIADAKLKVEVDPRIDAVTAALPGANCGACGFAGCSDYARMVVAGGGVNPPINACPVGGAACAEAIGKILGVKADTSAKKFPVVHCAAESSRRNQRTYVGSMRCSEAAMMSGVQPCAYGCLGFGDCASSCQFDALALKDGLPVVNFDKCTSCGACVKACPRGVIELIPFTQKDMPVVACSNHDPIRVVKQVCSVGCVGCSACTKQSDAFSMNNNLAKLDLSKVSDTSALATAFDKCPAAMLLVAGKNGVQLGRSVHPVKPTQAEHTSA